MNRAEGLYTIPLQLLKESMFDAEWKVDKAFVEDQKMEGVYDADIVAKVHFVKQNDFHTLSLQINGTVSVACDRCLDIFPLPITMTQDYIVKVGDENDELSESDDVILIAPDEAELVLTAEIYEMIMLALPMKKVHANEKDCNSDVISYMNQSKKNKEEKTDPRWDSLKNMFKN